LLPPLPSVQTLRSGLNGRQQRKRRKKRLRLSHRGKKEWGVLLLDEEARLGKSDLSKGRPQGHLHRLPLLRHPHPTSQCRCLSSQTLRNATPSVPLLQRTAARRSAASRL